MHVNMKHFPVMLLHQRTKDILSNHLPLPFAQVYVRFVTRVLTSWMWGSACACLRWSSLVLFETFNGKIYFGMPL